MLNALRADIQRAVTAGCREAAHRSAVLRALSLPGYVLHPDAPCRAGALTLLTCETIRGAPRAAGLRAASAVELHMEAAYMFDRAADGDGASDSGFSPSEEIALAIAIQTCGSAAASAAARLARRDAGGPALVRRFHVNFLRACAGQFLDASLEKQDTTSMGEALKMTSLKAGGFGRLSAAFGAEVATRDEEIIRRFGEFGANLFIYLQLVDDLRDACPRRGAWTDMTRGKKTLPLVFFRSRRARGPAARDAAPSARECGRIHRDVRRAYRASGADLFCAIVAETFLNRAKAGLADIKERVGSVERLERFVTGLEVSAQEIFAA